MKLVAGSYERYLWGWRVEKKKERLQPLFSYPAHLAAIKCIASWGSVLATGGADDTIKIFDTNANTDMGTLTHHTGAVTALAFYGFSMYPSNLLSASEDGMVCIWDTDTWVVYKSMKGHKKGVSDISIHPSGRLSVSVGRDSHLNMYDLLKGRRCFTSKLPSEASLISFSPVDGSSYVLVEGHSVIINLTEDGRPVHSLPHEKRVLCIAQQEDNLLFTGAEDGVIRAWDTRSATLAFSGLKAHKNRIRGLCMWGAAQQETKDVWSSFLVASASSDGNVRVWDTRCVQQNGDSTKPPSPVMEAETKARLTCLVTCCVKKNGWKMPNPDETFSEKEPRTLLEGGDETLSSKEMDGEEALLSADHASESRAKRRISVPEPSKKVMLKKQKGKSKKLLVNGSN